MAEQAANLRNLLGMFMLVDPTGFKELQLSLGRESIPVGGTLGRPKPPGDDSRALTPLEACISAAAALLRLRKVADPALQKVARRLQWANRFGLIGEIVAALAAAGVIAALWGQPPRDSAGHVTAVTMAAVGFCGAVMSLVARYLRRDLSGTDGTLAAAHRKLADSIWEAETLSAKLDLVASKGEAVAAGSGAKALVDRAEKLASELFRTVTDLGVAVGS